MSFATTNVQKNVFGSLKVTHGDWTGAVGDAPGTIVVEGGRIWLANFNVQDTDSPTVGIAPHSVSVSGALTTVSVYNHETVTTGRFIIIHS